MELHIGVDDTDSPEGFCTTYLGYELVVEFQRRGYRFLDFPYLVRLNPNIPFKTRGNAAISIHLDVPEDKIPEIVDTVEEFVLRRSEHHGKTSPGFALLKGGVTDTLRELYRAALTSLVPRSYVEELVASGVLDVMVFRLGKARGIVGALAAIGAYPLRDYTYELLVYRDPSFRGPKTVLDEGVIIEIDRRFRPTVFATYDYSERRSLVTPRGPDPVLMGFRSLSAETLLEVLEKYLKGRIKSLGATGFILYKSNQATNAHLAFKKRVAEIRPYDSVILEATVKGRPLVLEGGHVKVEVCDGSGCIDSMFYKETGRLNRVARLLREGDVVEVGGGVIPRRVLTLNAEFLHVLSVKPIESVLNPLCPVCGSRLESAGRNKGYRCRKCGFRGKFLAKNREELPRILEPGLYVQSTRAYRHLSRPLEVYGLERSFTAVLSPVAGPL
ncbi:TiaS agmantine-binding domain-containing protein [Infirmifilum sp. SLHALR2]|nr:MAG: hypothetical protein B7L53_08910 [Thermofilum sp. NZ13]